MPNSDRIEASHAPHPDRQSSGDFVATGCSDGANLSQSQQQGCPGSVALKRWLADNGWDDVFLDIDAREGLSPGERWERRAQERGRPLRGGVVPGVPTWLASAECKLEFRYAETLRKQLFLAIIKPCDPQDLPPIGSGACSTARAPRPRSASSSGNSPRHVRSYPADWSA